MERLAAAAKVTATPTIRLNDQDISPATPEELIAKVRQIVGPHRHLARQLIGIERHVHGSTSMQPGDFSGYGDVQAADASDDAGGYVGMFL